MDRRNFYAVLDDEDEDDACATTTCAQTETPLANTDGGVALGKEVDFAHSPGASTAGAPTTARRFAFGANKPTGKFVFGAGEQSAASEKLVCGRKRAGQPPQQAVVVDPVLADALRNNALDNLVVGDEVRVRFIHHNDSTKVNEYMHMLLHALAAASFFHRFLSQGR
jgi:hypothetical protein